MLRSKHNPRLNARLGYSRQHADNAAEIDVAGQSAGLRAFDMQLLGCTFGDNGDPRFLRCDIDEDVFFHGTSTPAFLNSTVVSYNGSPMIPE